MNICEAVAIRINQLLVEKSISLYALEKKSGVLHGTMMCIMKRKNKNVTLKTIMQIANGFDISLIEFLDEKIFNFDNIEVE